MTRWVQMGVFSPVLRPHCAGKGGNQRDIWRFDWPAFLVMRDYFRLRARLVPYLATAQRIAYETGVVPVHPLYYSFPGAPLAYGSLGLHQHSFGPDVWVAPVTSPAPAGGAGLSRSEIWFPPGTWIEWFSWQAHTAPAPSGAVFGRRFALAEAPVFSPAGAIVPLRTLPGSGARTGEGDAVGTAVDVPDAITLWVFPPPPGSLQPGAELSFSTRLYDDDGVSVAYATSDAYGWTNISCSWSRAELVAVDSSDSSFDPVAQDSVHCSIRPGGGNGFAEMPTARSWTLRFISTWPPAGVTVGGVSAIVVQEAVPDAWGDNAAWPTGASASTPVWAYAGGQASTWLHAGAPSPVDAALEIELTFPSGALADDPLLTSAIARKIARGQAAKHVLNAVGAAVAADARGVLRVARTGAVVEAAIAGAYAGDGAFNAESVDSMVDAVRTAYADLGDALHSALDDVNGLENLGMRGSPAVESMRALLTNALE